MLQALIKRSFRKTPPSQRPSLSRNTWPPSPQPPSSKGIILICANIHIRHVRSFLKHKEHHSGIAFLLADSKLILLNSFPWRYAAGTLSSWGKERTVLQAQCTTQSLVSHRVRSVYSFPGGPVVKNLPANAGDVGSTSGSGRSPGEGSGSPLQCSCLENSLDGGAWWVIGHDVTKSDMT